MEKIWQLSIKLNASLKYSKKVRILKWSNSCENYLILARLSELKMKFNKTLIDVIYVCNDNLCLLFNKPTGKNLKSAHY